MKKLLTDNIGLKVLALVAATILWLVVVNVDDPVIEKRFSGISVEVTNDEAITGQNKTYEILDGSDTVTVIVKGKRSILDQMSKDYIKATADIKNLTIMDTVPIEVRSTRLSDRLESIVSTTKNLKVHIEDLDRKQVMITVAATGTVNAGSVLGTVKPDVNILTVSGPVSVVRNIVAARAEIDVTGLGKDVSTTAVVHLYDANDEMITDPRVQSTVTSVHVDAQILETKEVEITAVTSGSPAEGYALTGVLSCDPARIRVAGKGSTYQELSRLVIPESAVSVAGATEDVRQIVNINNYLPEGIRLAEDDFDGNVEVYAQIEQLMSIEVEVPVENISIINVPEGYKIRYNLGNYHFAKGQYKKAEEDYHKALMHLIPYEKECPVKVNLALSMINQLSDDEWESFLAAESADDMDAKARHVEETLQTARSVLIEDGCAHADDEEGHDEQAQILKDEIDELLKKSGGQGGDEDNDQGGSD
ncbi:MAG: hypothetical protein J6Y57_11340, partial [Lachnospiraceae bacterium]|nr:hypothetical protein [Lachnospiraceae bacterium]